MSCTVGVVAQCDVEHGRMTTAEVSAAGKDPDLEPRLNRRRPFDLHWRKTPPAWRGNFEMAYRRLNPRVTADDLCCIQCGSRPCPFDHDEEKQKKFLGVDFVGKLVAEKNSLLDQLNEVMLVGWLLLISAYEQGQQCSAARGFSRRAEEFAVCRGICCLSRKTRNCPFLQQLYLIQGFSGSFLIL